MSKYVSFVLSLVILNLNAFAKPAKDTTKTNRFYSVYTDLNRDCKNAVSDAGEGEDIPL
jgi:hypothetical protein